MVNIDNFHYKAWDTKKVKNLDVDKYLDYAKESPGNKVEVEGESIEAGGGGDCFYYSLANRC